MYDVDIQKIEGAVAEAVRTLGASLLSLDVWDRSMGLPIASHNSDPVATALFNQLGASIYETLAGSGMLAFDSYFIMELEDSRTAVALKFSDRLAGAMLLDDSTTNLGILMALVIPRLLEQVREAESN